MNSGKGQRRRGAGTKREGGGRRWFEADRRGNGSYCARQEYGSFGDSCREYRIGPKRCVATQEKYGYPIFFRYAVGTRQFLDIFLNIGIDVLTHKTFTMLNAGLSHKMEPTCLNFFSPPTSPLSFPRATGKSLVSPILEFHRSPIRQPDPSISQIASIPEQINRLMASCSAWLWPAPCRA